MLDRETRIVVRGRWLAAAVVFFVGMSWGQAGFASSIGAAAAGFDEKAHAKYCDCGVLCRKAACCCEPRKSARPTPPPATAMATTVQILVQGNARPCMSAAPCGDPGVPTSRYAGPLGKPAAMPESGGEGEAELGSLCVASSRCILPDPRAARLDDPPEDRMDG